MTQRRQRTIRRETTASGIGFLTGADVNLRFLPAPPDHGIVFQRVDLADQPCVPADLEHLTPRQRRTGIQKDGTSIELIEHVMSALAGLQVDNCLVQLDAPETPGFDGSCKPVADSLLSADFEEQPSTRQLVTVDCHEQFIADDGAIIRTQPFGRRGMTITYLLDYGPQSPIPAQTYTVNVTPESFVDEICFARTFILDSEIEALKSLGYGPRTTAKDLLVFTANGVLDNELRAAEECARHKILDCIGDFALIGCDLQGYFHAWRTGHNSNHELMQKLKAASETDSSITAAA
ncbi:MAG: UDP-3-O-acyl-N-acetylglucosamine deacetylase [Planctomycetota bacterium]|jgi:UDP-3-O-[3-hydroxymyristoyl] N-acetylglucosamine deacetylase/UDP-3-O-[3-hydroxymyristoyl] N-acetylglucosamine deacetylase/3-hydroxyacyl-[acyl-carrier-protein] dehydratase